MEASTPRNPYERQLLQALGEQDGYKLVTALLRGPIGQTALAELAGVSTGHASNTMKVMEALQLVSRESPRSPWRLDHRDEVVRLLNAAGALADATLKQATKQQNAATAERRAPGSG